MKRFKLNLTLVVVSAIICLSLMIFPPVSGRILSVCWYPNGTGSFNDMCLIPQRMIWPREEIPLNLYCHSGYYSFCRDAEESLEEIFECDLVNQTMNESEANITLNPGEIYLFAPNAPLATTRFNRMRYDRFNAEIQIHSPFFLEQSLRNTWLHELGHALGLDHDANEESIMYRYMTNEIRSFTQTDIDLINSLYCEE